VQQESETLDFAQALRIVRRRALLVVFCALLVAAAAFGYSKLQTKEYTATASLVFHNTPLSQQVAGLAPSSSTSQLAQQNSNVELVGLGDMAAKTAKRLGLPEEEVREAVEVNGQGESNVAAVSATSTSPQQAAEIATVYAEEFVKEQQRANRRFFASALALVHRQLEELPASQRFGPVAVPLQNRAQALELLEGLKYDNVQLAQRALVPSSPSTPKTARNTALGLVLGLMIGLGLAFVLERFERDRRLRDPEDLEATYRLALLGGVPASRGLARALAPGERLALTETEAEAFQLIRARLRFSSGAKDVRSVLVCAAERGDGTTTVSRCLAEAAARMGSRVLLLEADLRTPALAGRFGLHPGPGLPEVLSGAAAMDAAIQSIDVGSPAGKRLDGGPKTLDVLACGRSLPSNPGELIEGHAMEIVLDRARSIYDLVLIDAPSPTEFADAFSLFSRVDGVVVVSCVGHTQRTAANRLVHALEGSGARQIGLIANGVPPSSLSSYSGASGAGGAAVPADLPAAAPLNGAQQQPEAQVPTTGV
jgi:polysaccharide biosynthesis transport protein